jgi:hypothetical protein
MSEFKNAIDNYAKYVVQQAKSNLTKEKKGGGKLYNSLDYIIQQRRSSGGRFATGYSVEFLMEDYGLFQDQGVKGKDPSRVSPNAKIKGQQAPNSKFKFGSGKSNKTFKDFVKQMSAWAKRKNVRFRQYKTVDGKKKSTGKYAEGNYKSLGYVIASNIYNRGIRPSMFFTKPFEAGIKRFGDDIAVSYGNDVLKELVKK